MRPASAFTTGTRPETSSSQGGRPSTSSASRTQSNLSQTPLQSLSGFKKRDLFSSHAARLGMSRQQVVDAASTSSLYCPRKPTLLTKADLEVPKVGPSLPPDPLLPEPAHIANDEFFKQLWVGKRSREISEQRVRSQTSQLIDQWAVNIARLDEEVVRRQESSLYNKGRSAVVARGDSPQRIRPTTAEAPSDPAEHFMAEAWTSGGGRDSRKQPWTMPPAPKPGETLPPSAPRPWTSTAGQADAAGGGKPAEKEKAEKPSKQQSQQQAAPTLTPRTGAFSPLAARAGVLPSSASASIVPAIAFRSSEPRSSSDATGGGTAGGAGGGEAAASFSPFRPGPRGLPATPAPGHASSSSAELGMGPAGMARQAWARPADLSEFFYKTRKSDTSRPGTATVPSHAPSDFRPLSAAHANRSQDLMECDRIKTRLAEMGVHVSRGVLERVLSAPVVEFSPVERATYFPAPLAQLPSNPLAPAKTKSKGKKGGKKGGKKKKKK